MTDRLPLEFDEFVSDFKLVGACIFPTSNSSGSLCLSDIVPSTRQHSTTGWSDQTTPPVNTVPQGGQIKPLHPSIQYHRVVRSSCTPPINTVPQGGQIKPLHSSTQYHRVVRSNHSTHQHSTTGWSDQTTPLVNTVPQGGQMESL